MVRDVYGSVRGYGVVMERTGFLSTDDILMQHLLRISFPHPDIFYP